MRLIMINIYKNLVKVKRNAVLENIFIFHILWDLNILKF